MHRPTHLHNRRCLSSSLFRSLTLSHMECVFPQFSSWSGARYFRLAILCNEIPFCFLVRFGHTYFPHLSLSIYFFITSMRIFSIRSFDTILILRAHFLALILFPLKSFVNLKEGRKGERNGKRAKMHVPAVVLKLFKIHSGLLNFNLFFFSLSTSGSHISLILVSQQALTIQLLLIPNVSLANIFS